MRQEFVLGVFMAVSLGMLLGRLPGLAIDRAGVALLGAAAMLACGAISSPQAWASIDMPTMCLLLGLMLISAQLRLSGFYTRIARRLAAARLSPPRLLLLVMSASAGLASVLVNDIICLAMTPLLTEGCLRRGLNPLPFLLGLACAANIGSAATLIGNPQNMLIGQVGGLEFGAFALDALPPVVLSLLAAWGIIVCAAKGKWESKRFAPPVPAVPYRPWPAFKGCLLMILALAGFLFVPVPREAIALAAGGLALLSRRTRSAELFRSVDWELLVLFAGLFVVNAGFARAGLLDGLYRSIRSIGVDLAHPVWFFLVTALLSNLISNVPATMLLLPVAGTPQMRLLLALASTFAGNLLLLGSIANLIVAEQAGRLGVFLTWRKHLRTGLPVTLASFAIAAAWLWLRWPGLFVAG